MTDAVSLPLVSTTFPNLTLGAFSNDAIYTPKEVEDLLGFAKDRGVRVVLELYVLPTLRENFTLLLTY